MLLKTSYKVGDVVTVKLISGEELVGKFESEDDKSLTLHYPLTLIATEKGLGLQQFLFTAEVARSYTIRHAAYSICVPTAKQFAESYSNQTSAIVKAPAGLASALKM
jgi:hypothetical protein